MFTKNELEFIKDCLNYVLYQSQESLDVNKMNKEARAMLFDITSKIMMKQRGDDPSTWKPLLDMAKDESTYSYDHNDPIDKPMVDEQREELLQFNPALLECVNKYQDHSKNWNSCFAKLQNVDTGNDIVSMKCCQWWQEALSMCERTLMEEHAEIIAKKGEKEHIRICDYNNYKAFMKIREK